MRYAWCSAACSQAKRTQRSTFLLFCGRLGRLIQAIDQIVKATEAAPSRPSRKWPLLALGAIGCLILAAIGIWAYPSISGYVKSAVTRVAPYIDQDFYYKLSTEFRGSDMKLDVINGGPNDNLTQLEPDQNVSGQYWRFLANADGTFRLTTLFRGPNMCLDIFNDGPNNNQPHLAECANVSGQLWTLTKTSKPVENAAKHD
jgi:ricin-type beta-trefoil lectin protein